MSLQPVRRQRAAGFKALFWETALVALIGGALAFVANALSPRGLKIAHNYFPAGTNAVLPAPWVAEAPPDAASSHAPKTAPQLISVPRLIDQGLQGIDYDQALRFFNDPRRQNGLVVFIDARNDTQYPKGHIPGAYLFDPYHPDEYLNLVLPVCQRAEQIVVYCVASECEDSQLAAVLLRNAGVANEKLFVYVGGFTEWSANRQPVETGARGRGTLHQAGE